ncbi:MAG: radical SAM protein [Flavobacteriales bacterium]|nr:radical SAM protein [Flavobacteriales bacterium]
MSQFDHIQSIYWVFTQLCNDQCDHCYNLSGPHGSRISHDECMQIIDNMPPSVGRIILSGGEPLADRKLLHAILDRIQEKYGQKTQVMVQTNGDLLTPERLDTLIEKGVTRFDIASIDRYHKNAGNRLMELAELFDSRGVDGEDKDPLIESDNYLTTKKLSWGYWGATEDMWLGGNWARGRAMQKNIWKKDPSHNFCNVLSGGVGFLTGAEGIPQEISIQLWAINPCCPGTVRAIGDARTEKVTDVMDRVVDSPIFQKINEGDPIRMGESIGISAEYAQNTTNELQNVCLWCDEFFRKHFDMKKLAPKEAVE